MECSGVGALVLKSVMGLPKELQCHWQECSVYDFVPPCRARASLDAASPLFNQIVAVFCDLKSYNCCFGSTSAFNEKDPTRWKQFRPRWLLQSKTATPITGEAVLNNQRTRKFLCFFTTKLIDEGRCEAN